MIKLNKDDLMKEVEERYDGATHDDETYALADEAIDLAEEWLNENEDRVGDMTRRKIRMEVRKYIKERMDFSNTDKAYFVPTFIWVWAAQQIITWLVRIIIERYLSDSSQPES